MQPSGVGELTLAQENQELERIWADMYPFLFFLDQAHLRNSGSRTGDLPSDWLRFFKLFVERTLLLCLSYTACHLSLSHFSFSSFLSWDCTSLNKVIPCNLCLIFCF